MIRLATRRNQRRGVVLRYTSYQFEGTRIRLPLVHIGLESDAAKLTTVGLIDSGATSTFLPPEMAEVLKLEEVEGNCDAG